MAPPNTTEPDLIDPSLPNEDEPGEFDNLPVREPRDGDVDESDEDIEQGDEAVDTL